MMKSWRILVGVFFGLLAISILTFCARVATTQLVSSATTSLQDIATNEIRTGMHTDTPQPTSTAEMLTSTPIPPVETESIDSLLARSAIKIEAKGAGIDKLDLEIQNLTDETLDVLIPLGTLFVSDSNSIQSMVLRKPVTTHLEPGELQQVELEVACANMEREVPGSDSTFMINDTAYNSPLVPLMKALQQEAVEYSVVQAAVWIVTDDADFDELGRLTTGLRGSNLKSRAIGADEAVLAMKIIDELGIDITETSIWSKREMFTQWVNNRKLISWLEEVEQREPSSDARVILKKKKTRMIFGSNSTSFAFSPDGKQIATNGGDIFFWDVEGGDILNMPVLSSGQGDLDFSPDGKHLVSASNTGLGGEISLWDMTSNDPFQVIKIEQMLIIRLEYTPQGNQLAVMGCVLDDDLKCKMPEVSIWNVAQRIRVREFSNLAEWTMAFTPDGSEMVAPVCPSLDCHNPEIQFWNLNTGQLSRSISPGLDDIYRITIRGDRLVLLGEKVDNRGDKTQALQVWDLDKESIVSTAALSAGEFWCGNPTISPIEDVVVTATCAWGKGAKIVKWQLPSAQRGDTLTTIPQFARMISGDNSYPSYTFKLDFSPDGNTLAVLGEVDRFVYIYDFPK